MPSNSCCPYAPSVDLPSKDAKAVLEKSVHTKLSNVGRLMQIQFSAPLGKVATKFSDRRFSIPLVQAKT